MARVKLNRRLNYLARKNPTLPRIQTTVFSHFGAAVRAYLDKFQVTGEPNASVAASTCLVYRQQKVGDREGRCAPPIPVSAFVKLTSKSAFHRLGALTVLFAKVFAE